MTQLQTSCYILNFIYRGRSNNVDYTFCKWCTTNNRRNCPFHKVWWPQYESDSLQQERRRWWWYCDIIDWWRDVIVLFSLCLRILNGQSPSFMGRFRIIPLCRTLLNLNSPLCCHIFIAGGSTIFLTVTFLLDLLTAVKVGTVLFADKPSTEP